MIEPLDYDSISPTYDQRYARGGPPGVIDSLQLLVEKTQSQRLLEVGCGTGHWLLELQVRLSCFGLDYSAGMLSEARQKNPDLKLARGIAGCLPFANNLFDMVICINSLHHFDQPGLFVSESYRLLRKGGVLAIVGMDPSMERDRWYVYDYFPGTCMADRLRYPSGSTIFQWMEKAGFLTSEQNLVSLIQQDCLGREVLHQPFIDKHSTSQLAMLSDEAYLSGVRQIEDDIVFAEKQDRGIQFITDIALYLVHGLKS